MGLDADGLLKWIKTDYAPLMYSQPDATILQNIQQVTNYFNTHSGVRILQMYNVTSSGPNTTDVLTIDPHIKLVTEVLPSSQVLELALADPTWTLLGIQVMNYLSADLIAINEGYKNYLAYLGNDFRWIFEPSQDPSVGGQLFIQQLPAPAGQVAVIGAQRILPGDIITEEHILDWMQRACICYTKIKEGNVLRKADSINVKNDGQAMIQEHTEEWEKLKADLKANGRWICMAQRI